MRTFRRTRLLAATGIALTTLALTACDNGTGTRDEGSAPRPTPTSTTPAPATAHPSSDPAQDAEAAPQQPRRTSDSTHTSQASAPRMAICNGANTEVTAQPVPRPLNHMLLTVTNTGSKPCTLMYYPVLRFDEMQWVPQPIAGTKPQAVPTLAPGASGYAGVLLSAADGSGDGGTTAERLTIAFQGRTPNSSGGASATPALPAEGVYYDSSLRVTYWQSTQEDALS
ncbi:DUF4232 domain-containing protein [Streptomyces sp. NPDC089424]|uniref:DUF4232 domain-containing protein n=1 Tax=Streptomyces sp. NPDC089424 TaxID=3365917 RepID=UPI00381FAF55